MMTTLPYSTAVTMRHWWSGSFADDVAFSGGTRDYRGKAALKAVLDWAHDGVREVMRPQNILQREDLIFVEVDMDFHATKERPDFSFRASASGRPGHRQISSSPTGCARTGLSNCSR